MDIVSVGLKEQKKGRFDVIVQSFDGSSRKVSLLSSILFASLL